MIPLALDARVEARLQASLKRLNKGVGRQILASVTHHAALPIHRRAVQLAPRRTGRLARDMTVLPVKVSDTNASYAVAAPKTGGKPKSAWYWRLVEYGHWIVRGDNRVGYVGPRPFLRPAMDSEKRNSIETARREFWEKISAELRRMG